MLFQEKMSAPRRLINSKAWSPLSFLLEIYHHYGNTRQNTKNSKKSKDYPESKTLRELKKLTLIDWYIVINQSSDILQKKAKGTVQWRKSTSEKMSIDSIQS